MVERRNTQGEGGNPDAQPQMTTAMQEMLDNEQYGKALKTCNQRKC